MKQFLWRKHKHFRRMNAGPPYFVGYIWLCWRVVVEYNGEMVVID